MNLNNLSPAEGSKHSKKRVGRGIGSTLGKTCGRGHKGQKSRSGGFHKVGFEGGQQPLQRRLPKFGFSSRTNLNTEKLTLAVLNKVELDKDAKVTVDVLRELGLVKRSTKKVKFYASDALDKSVKICDSIKLTKGALEKVTSLGGEVIAQ